MIKIKDIVQYLESWAPPLLQEDYDNSGLIVGDRDAGLNGTLISLDCTEQVVEDAIKKNCNLIVAHHPIVFRGLTKITGSNYVERTIIKAIKHDIAIYAIHTNLDNINTGVNAKVAQMLGLHNVEILRPKTDDLFKLTTFIPKENTEDVMSKLHEAGAGMIGDYKNCSFRIEGTGTFLPVGEANPTIGELDKLEKVNEDRVEVIFPSHSKSNILRTLFSAHPYEEVAYYLHRLINQNKEAGSGMIGTITEPTNIRDFLDSLKKIFNVPAIRHTSLVKEQIQKIALCGGSGSFLLKDAIRAGADLFITGDFKYHEFFDADGQIIIADIGHYESEQFTKDLIYEKLSENFANIALHFTEVNTNPIFYR